MRRASPEAEALEESLDRLDEVFRGVDLPSDLGGCGYCWAKGWESLRLPVHEVPEDDLVSFAAEGPDHWDAYVPMLRRLFPRIARMLAHSQLHVDAGLVLSHLTDAGWLEWDADERAAVDAYLHALFKKILSEEPKGDLHGDEVLEGVSAATGDVGPWLELWDQLPGEHKTRHLPGVIWRRPLEHSDPEWFMSADRRRRREGWWAPGTAVALGAWLRRPEIERQLWELYERDPDPQVERAIQTVETLRAPPDEEYLREVRHRTGVRLLTGHVRALVEGYEEAGGTPTDERGGRNDDLRGELYLPVRSSAAARFLSETGALRDGLTVGEATDFFRVVASPEVYRLLRTELGRTPLECRQFLVRSLCDMLLAPA